MKEKSNDKEKVYVKNQFENNLIADIKSWWKKKKLQKHKEQNKP